MPAFGNPVQGIIRPMGSPLIVGSYRVTCDFACHMARPNPIPGIDLNDATCGKPVLAMTSGTISLIRLGTVGATTSDKASIFRIKRPDGWEAGVAHLKIGAGFAVDQSIAEGTQIGTVDKIGAVGCHVHMGAKDPSGVEVDAWPLLKQNGATEGDELDPSFSPKPNRTVTVNKGARHRLDPSLNPANIAIASDPGGPLGFPLMGTVVGTAVNGNAIWYAYWRPETSKVYYLHTSTCGAETPWEPTGGHSDAELAEAAKRARANGIADAAVAAGAVI